MSSWAQQLEAIRRAAQGGVRARTNAQRSQRLPLANNRLREVLLSRPNGELTRAGQFYYGLVGGPLEAVRRGAAPHPRGGPARGSRCGAGCICATPPARTSLRPYPPSPKGMGRLRSLATLTPLEGGSGERTALFCSRNREIAGMGEGPRPAARSWPATRRRRGASPKNAGCRRRRARPSRAA